MDIVRNFKPIPAGIQEKSGHTLNGLTWWRARQETLHVDT